MITNNKIKLSDLCKVDRFLFCLQLLKSKSKKQTNKQCYPKLTSEEKILFDNEEILSSYQHILANACAQHRNQQQVLDYHLIFKLFYV